MPQVPLVHTKFLPPRLAGPILRRPRLLDALRRHLDSRLLLLSADAGYGKTMLLVGLIGEVDIPCAWYRLERTDRDPLVFLEHLVEAIRLHVPGFGKRLLGSLQAGEVRHEAVIARLVHDFGRLPDLLVVLDDYHLVDESQEVNPLVDALLDHLPPSIHFLISTRTTPHLSLSRLRAQNSLYELDADSLRFTSDEIEELFVALGAPLDPETLQSLTERTEGWVLSLVLAYHSIRAKDPDAARTFLRGLQGSTRVIYDYLSAEVLRSQPPSVRSFLRATSILPRLHPEICNALLQIATSRRMLQHLERHNLFTHCLDEKRIWYRYHPLFQEFLQARLMSDEGPSRVADLHSRAAAILERWGFMEEAFDQYGRAGTWEEAGRLLAQLGDRLLEAGRLQTLRDLFGQLPGGVIDASPDLLLLSARQMEFQGRWTEARERFRRAHERFAARGDSSGMLRSLAGVALTHVRQGQYAAAMDICRNALARVSPDDLRSRAELSRLLAGCYLETDDLDRGAQYMQEALEAFRALGDRRAEARVLHNLAYSVRFVRGEFPAALRLEEDAVRICEELGDASTLGVCLIGLGHLRLAMGDHQAATSVLERLLRLCEEWHAEPGRAYALALMADAHREEGDRSRARALYDEALALGERLEEPTVRLHALLGLAMLQSRDDAAGAEALAQRALALARLLKYEWFRGRSLMVLAAITRFTEPERAKAHLAEVVQIFTQLQARYDLARAHLLLAALVEGGDRHRHLEAALTLGERGGYDALFLRAEREVARPLLVEAFAQRILAEYVGALLAQAGANEDLLPLLFHPDSQVRVQAARLAAEVGEHRARRGLQRLLRDGDRHVREAAEQALEHLTRRAPPPLRVHLLGAFKLFRGSEAVPDAVWKRRTARVLFQYLVGQRPKVLPEEAILVALWPGMEVERAHSTFHAALHALRKALEPDLAEARASAYVIGRGDQYGLGPRVECWVDAEEFMRRARLGKSHEKAGEIEEAIDALLQADRLYAGDYLEENPYQEWTASERERLRQVEVEVLVRLGELLEGRDADAAVEASRRALAMDPYSESACRGLMRILARVGERAEALQQYRALERLLQRDLQVAPSSETTALYRSLLGQDR